MIDKSKRTKIEIDCYTYIGKKTEDKVLDNLVKQYVPKNRKRRKEE